MVKVFKIDGNALPDGAILMEGGKTTRPGGIGGLPVSAWYCEPGIGAINVDDPGGDYDLEGWHTFTVDEDESIGTERQWSGWLIGRRITRGPYKDGPARVWDVDILEINGLFNLEVFRANSAQRPAETDVARIQWMIASAPMAGTPIADDGRLSTADPRDLSPAEFVRSFPTDMATNTAGQSGKNVYAYWSHADAEVAIHYDHIGAGPDCTLRVSNDMADTDSTTFYPFMDAELDADGYSLYTGVLLDYVGGAVYGRNPTLIAALSPTEFSPINFLRDQTLRSDRISRLTTANAYLATYLAAAAEEKADITLGITVGPDEVGLIEAGMNIDVKLTHIPGLEAFTTLPIIRLSKVPTPDRTDTWDVRLQMSTNLKPYLAPGGPPDVFPVNPCNPDDATLVHAEQGTTTDLGGGLGQYVLSAAPTPGNTQIVYTTMNHGGTISPDGYTSINGGLLNMMTGSPPGSAQNFDMEAWYRIAEPGDTTTIATHQTGANKQRIAYLEYAGVWNVDDFATNVTLPPTFDEHNPLDFAPITLASPRLLVAGLVPGASDPTAWDGSPIAPLIEATDFPTPNNGHPLIFAGYYGAPAGAITLQMNDDEEPFTLMTGHMSIVVALTCDDSASPPAVGQPVVHEHVADGDGTTTTFTTHFPYAPGSLRVYVDGVQIIVGLVETDPTTGDFTLDFAPHGVIGDTRAEIVTASYQVGWS